MGLRCRRLVVVLIAACFISPTQLLDEWAEVVLRRARANVIIVIPATFTWLSFAANAFCSLQRVGRNETVILALDRETHGHLQRHGVPVYMDPSLHAVARPGLDNVLYGKVGHSRMMCSKLAAVLRLLRLGLNVMYCDSDISVLQDPLAIQPVLDLTFQFGGMGDPRMAGVRHPGSLGCFPEHYRRGPCKVNAGWFFARSCPAVLAFMQRAATVCFARRSNDQYVMSLLLAAPHSHNLSSDSLPSWGCFDPCKYANGRTYFVHCRPQLEGVLPVMVHANWITHSRKSGVVYKKRQLWLYHLWSPGCVALPTPRTKSKPSAGKATLACPVSVPRSP
eukprot:GGOE01022392.1.p1 GENE.GGOE01022392.1~~GGOE01022392.1.p1  ORF type:complete len:335 (+),score=79.39 GGOE01022392.1:111-1115(+)